MGRLASRLRFGGTVAVSLIIGFVIGFVLCSVQPMDHDSVSIEPLPPKLDAMLQDAAVFFYDTMREMFQRTDGLQEDSVSQRALVVFNKYRPRLEPRCWLVNVHPSYGFVAGEALFPSGDVFEVGIGKKPDKGWTLDWLNHMGTRYFYHNLSENQQGGTEGISGISLPKAD